MCCLFKKTTACRQEPCTEAQGVRCCGACPYRKNCVSRCKIPEQLAQKNTPQDEVATGDQLTMEDML
jgi:hypothetical protein